MEPVKDKRLAFSDSIKLISVNVNGFRAREGQIRRLLQNEGSNCIMAISDTKLKSETVIREIEGYTMIRSDKIYTTAFRINRKKCWIFGELPINANLEMILYDFDN